MASLEWIKLTCDLPDKWQTRRLARVLKLKVDDVIGKLFRFWVYVENQSTNGFIPRLDADDLDGIVGKKGFALALAEVGWLAFDADGLRVPHFDEYMGAASREREAAAERMRRQRERDRTVTPTEPEQNTGVTDTEHQPNGGVTETEHVRNDGVTEPSPKRQRQKESQRENQQPPNQPAGATDPRPRKSVTRPTAAEADPRFAEFWDAYPNKINKPDAAAVFAELNPSPELFAEMLASIARQKAGPQWRKNQGEFIPQPANWLARRRWEERPPEVGQPPPDGVPAADDPLAQMYKFAAEMGLSVGEPGGAP